MDNAIIMTDRDRIDYIDIELTKVRSILAILANAYDCQDGQPPKECLVWALTDAFERISQLQPVLLQVGVDR